MTMRSTTVWGILRRPNSKQGKWRKVITPGHVFQSWWEAIEKCMDYMTDAPSHYLYKPVRIGGTYDDGEMGA